MRDMISPSGFNPFALLMDPASVIGAVESSAGLSRLQTRVFRPLDSTSRVSTVDVDLSAYDAEVEAQAEEDSGGLAPSDQA